MTKPAVEDDFLSAGTFCQYDILPGGRSVSWTFCHDSNLRRLGGEGRKALPLPLPQVLADRVEL